MRCTLKVHNHISRCLILELFCVQLFWIFRIFIMFNILIAISLFRVPSHKCREEFQFATFYTFHNSNQEINARHIVSVLIACNHTVFYLYALFKPMCCLFIWLISRGEPQRLTSMNKNAHLYRQVNNLTVSMMENMRPLIVDTNIINTIHIPVLGIAHLKYFSPHIYYVKNIY